jgi:tRNA nucleotidyltransferase/poly(A) polymerase
MKKALEILNELKEKGLIENYAIGGGIRMPLRGF